MAPGSSGHTFYLSGKSERDCDAWFEKVTEVVQKMEDARGIVICLLMRHRTDALDAIVTLTTQQCFAFRWSG